MGTNPETRASEPSDVQPGQTSNVILQVVPVTVSCVDKKKRPRMAARFEVISDFVNAGEAYHHTVTVDRSGRVRSVVVCVEREVDAAIWSGDNVPTADDLAEALVDACRDDHHESRIRLLSLVVHGLLPTGDNLYDVEIPDAVLDERLGFGPRTSYRANIRRDVLAALRKHSALEWSQKIQTEGTEENAEFVAQITAALDLDPEWKFEKGCKLLMRYYTMVSH